jgi:alginate O-acetyltransferase complex protein AlgI
MSFASPVFLYLFFPAVILLYLLLGRKFGSPLLLVASLVFYAWLEPRYFPVLLLSILVNYYLGRQIEKKAGQSRPAKRLATAGVLFNLILLALAKLFAAYAATLAGLSGLDQSGAFWQSFNKFVYLPVGVSFFSFAAISYIMDVYHRRTPAEGKLSRFALYLALFPKIIAGPIVRYREISAQLVQRSLNVEGLAGGTRRFIPGMAKKVLIGDVIGLVADKIFTINAQGSYAPGFKLAWIGLLCYTLQIYYDFSGYTDMAIGLGQIFGFKFAENFNYPYISKSISEFWRRWHMTLSNWFRDYLFYPLERKRRGGPERLRAMNILIVFLATGLWHGVTLNFIIWGLLFGAAIVFETSAAGKWLKSWPAFFQHVYTLLIVMAAWVFFRTADLGQAARYFKALLNFSAAGVPLPYSLLPVFDTHTLLAIVLGLLFAAPLAPALQGWLQQRFPGRAARMTGRVVQDLAALGVLILALLVLAGSTFQAYIYARF